MPDTAPSPAPGPASRWLDDEAALEAVYGEPSRKALVKELDRLTDHYRAFVEASPFVVLSSVGPEGLDSSPRGDPAGFVRVDGSRRLLLPDRPGNNRIDTLRNIVRDPRVSLLFLVPGVGETLRVNGRARISVEPALLASFAVRGRDPRSVLAIDIDRVYFQCQKALVRSRLWDPEARREPGELPSAGEMIHALDAASVPDAAAYDRDYPARMRREGY